MKIFVIVSTAAALLSLPAMATGLEVETNLGTTIEQVKASLADMGYDVRKGEVEDGRIEIYVVKDGWMGEIYVDPATGKVTQIKMK